MLRVLSSPTFEPEALQGENVAKHSDTPMMRPEAVTHEVDVVGNFRFERRRGSEFRVYGAMVAYYGPT